MSSQTVAGAKRWLSRSITSVEAIFDTVEMDMELLSVEMDTLVRRVTVLEDEHMKMLQSDSSLEEDDITKEVDAIHAYFQKANLLKAKYQKVLKSSSQKEDDGDARTTSSTRARKAIKLPTLKPQRFDGKASEWLEFEASFRLTIAEDEDLDDVARFLYLRSLLDGEPKRLIGGLPATNQNYDAAWKLLVDRYGDTEAIKDSLLDEIYKIKKVSVENTLLLKELIDDVGNKVAQLNGLGVDLHKEMGPLLIKIVRDRLPNSWKLEWNRRLQRSPEEKNFENFMQFLYDELKARKDESESESEDLVGSDSTASALLNRSKDTASREVREKRTLRCTFCSGDHFPSDCRKKMTVEQRWDIVKKNRCCFRCALPGHSAKFCRVSRQSLCKCKNRKQPPHVPNLCLHVTGDGGKREEGNVTGSVPEAPTNRDREDVNNSRAAGFLAKNPLILMRSVGLTAKGCKGHINSRALCDTGCSYTTISAKLAEKIGAKKLRTVTMDIESFGGVITSGKFDVVEFDVEGISGFGQEKIEALVGPPYLGGRLEIIPKSCLRLAKDKGCFPLADTCVDGSSEIDILIGEDFYDTIVTGPALPLGNKLKATPTKFGWMIHGKLHTTSRSAKNMISVAFRCQGQIRFDDFWKLEHLGIAPLEIGGAVAEKTRSEFIRENGKYFVTWPWKEGKAAELATNRELSIKRLESLLRRQSPEEFRRYDTEVNRLLEEGFIEKAPALSVTDTLVSYLAHRAVVKEDRETMKIRLVFDASAKSKGGLSLNECLEVGENQLPLLFGVLLRFRMGRIAICGDLAQAFLMMRLQEKERDVCRFFWIDSEGKLTEFRFTRVFFGSVCGPFLLGVVLNDLMDSFNADKKETVSEIKDNVYVDDMVLSVEDDKEAIRVWKDSKEIFASGGFELRKLKSNSSTVLNQLCGEQSSKDSTVLGVTWKAESDLLFPGKKFIQELETHTKRGVVSLLGQLYDPLGLLSPLILPLKLFIQELWLRKVPWDKTLCNDDLNRVSDILSSWKDVEKIELPRWVQSTKTDLSFIVVFTDASERAYAACAFLISQSKDKICSHLLCSKSRLAPPKSKGWTIPKLELMGALVGSRLGSTVAKELGLDPDSVLYFTDSKIVYHWANSDHRRWEVFISNRVREIKENGGKWHWCPGTENPADLPSRGCGVNSLLDNNLWWKGPKWLQETGVSKLPECSENDVVQLHSFLVCTPKEIILDYEKDFVEPKRTSKWLRTLRSTVYVLRFLKHRDRKGKIQLSELEEAKSLIFSQIQKALFPSELEHLKESRVFPKNSKLVSLNPFLDVKSGLIRIGGRLQMADLPFQEKHPVVLARCGVMDQIVLFYHETLEHGGPGAVITKMRQDGIWILRAKKSVSSIIRSCRKCKRMIAAPGAEVTPPFPTSRVSCGRAFAVTGLDLGGPLFLKDGTKVWFALFTCMAVRAIHLELIPSLSEADMNQGLQRFMNRRGVPETIISDHGSNFVALRQTLIDKNVPLKWDFVVERGSWWGGCWERLVGVTKGLIKRGLGKQLLKFWELETALTNIEKVVNLRPISYMWESSGVPVPLYPEIFLLPAQRKPIQEDLSVAVLERLKWGENVLQRWQEEYCSQVLGNQGNVWKEDTRRVNVGDVVLIEGEQKNRLTWKMGLVIKVSKSNRVVEIRVASGKILRRPLQRVFNLEVTKNETYCVCKQGYNNRDMIACDGEKCDTEWFHFECVGLTEAPEGDWFCPECLKSQTQAKN